MAWLVERHATLDAFSTYGTRWNELAGDRLFCRTEWLQSWWEAYQNEGELYVITIKDETGRVRGIAPWYRERSIGRGATLRFLGSGKVCSEYLTILTDSSESSETLHQLAEWLIESCASRLHGWDQIELQGGAQDDPALAELSAWLEKRDARVDRRPGPGCWELTIPESFESLCQNVGRNTRRKLRKLRPSVVPETTWRWVTSDQKDQTTRLFEGLIELHQARWRSVQVAGCFSDPRFEMFLRSATERYLATDRVWLSGIEEVGKLAAVTLFLRANGRYYAYITGADPERKDDEPGWLLQLRQLLAFIEHDVKTVDFLRGNERYKIDLRAQFIAQTDWYIGAPHLSGRFRHQVGAAERWLRDWGKQVLRGNPSETTP